MSRRFRVGRVMLMQVDDEDLQLVVFSPNGPATSMRLEDARLVQYEVDATVEIRCDYYRRVIHLAQSMGDVTLLNMLTVAYEYFGNGYVASRIRGLIRSELRQERTEGPLLTSEISCLMKAVDKRRGDIVPCLLGAPGIGKTEGIEEFARTHGRNVVHIIASQILPTEVSGMTMPNQETHSMDVFDHARLSHMRDGDILFLDELLKGQQQVLSACLTLVQERRLMSGHRLPDVIIVAAANPLASAKMLPEEIKQRFLFIDVEFDSKSWCDYMRERGVPHPERLTSWLATEGGDGALWNTLTPRTATKLTLWYRDSGRDPMVRRVIETEFSSSVFNAISNALDYNVFAKKNPMDEVRAFISQEMSRLPMPETPEDVEVRAEVKDMLDAESIDVATLMDRIKNMSGGDEIMEALRRETIDLSVTGIGEE